MKERIRIIMENEHLTPSAFADMIQIGRAVMSHILNGRNNPSLEVVTRIIQKFPHVNPTWLINGNGNMYNNNTDVSSRRNDTDVNYSNNDRPTSPDSFDLFSQNAINTINDTDKVEYGKENAVKSVDNTIEETVKQQIIYQKSPDKKVTKIIIYYSDNTFETFEANNRPL